MTFHVGQRVVCVNSASTSLFGVHDIDSKEITRGRIYTIAASVSACCPQTGAMSARFIDHAGCVHLVEIRRIPLCSFCGHEVPFAASRFRPVQHRETDISALQKLCDPTREVVR